MEGRKRRASCQCSRRTLFFSTPLLFLSIILPSSSYAQLVTDDVSSNTDSVAPVSTSLSSSIPGSASITGLPSTMITSFVSSSHPNSTTSSVRSTKAPETTLLPNSPPPPASGVTKDAREGVFNYYFLFLALFGVLIGVLLWWLHRQKKRRKEQYRRSAQNALAQDLDGWANTRRWMHGGWRHNRGATFVRREDGLDENGEAPPPYEPKPPDVVTLDSTRPTQDSQSGLTIPMRTLSRADGEGIQLPGYQEVIDGEPTGSTRPDTRETHMARPETAYTQQNASNRDLLQNQRPLGQQ